MHARLIIFCLMFNLLAASAAPGATGNDKAGTKTSQAREEQALPLTILSIIPTQGEPGMSVTLSGSGFTDNTVVFLGNTEVPTEVMGPKQLSFTIPKLHHGLYALFLRRGDEATSRAYNFTVLAPKPVVYSLAPDTIPDCAADRDREVVITGRNFQERSQVLFDGAAIRGRFISPDTFAFTVPRIAPGLHQVQVKNPEDTLSGAQGLFIDGRPEIQTINAGTEYVNYYNLVIDGRNFRQDSTLVITEEREIEPTGLQPAYEVKRLRGGTANATERERVIYVNCNQIIYQRYPYSTALKNFKVQIVNPGGEESSVVQVSAP
jgi:IPT/TIG domain